MWRLPTPGLRGRLIACLIASAAATLLVAALTLLPPLDSRLRKEDIESLTQAGAGIRPALKELDAKDFKPGATELRSIVRPLVRRTGARVVIVDRSGRHIVDSDRDASSSDPHGGPFDDALRAIATGHTQRGVRDVGSAGAARVAVPVDTRAGRYAVALRRSLEASHSAASTVKQGFVTAAIAGFAVALLLGIAFAATLLRRLRRLHQAALDLAAGSGQAVPIDESHDEVGDLARAFSVMQERLTQQEAVRRAFVSTASHELKTPLASLDNMLELLDDDLRSSPIQADDARKQLGSARAQSQRLGMLASDLLELSRLDIDLALQRELLELGELCRAVVAEFDIRAAERGTGIRLVDIDKPRWVFGDPGAIARILRILADNAIRYGSGAAPVTIRLARREDRAAVEVKDVGPVILPEEREVIFERFKRGSAASIEAGFGLGLAIARELASRMEGELLIDECDEGACFVLLLPLTPTPS